MSKAKEKLKEIFRLAPVRHVLILAGALVICAHLLTRNMKGLNMLLSENMVQPLHRAMASALDALPFSLAEVLIGLAGAAAVIYVIWAAVRLISRPERLKQLYLLAVSLVCIFAVVYAMFCVMWGIYYYGADFTEKSGLPDDPISVEDLETVTRYFSKLASEYGEMVPRDENGAFAGDRERILSVSDEVYAKAEEVFPCLEGPALHAKGIRFSVLMSYTDYTGFFFPFTGEANVNTDFPPCLLPSTVAHELAHQRGVAKEQEANFCAVVSSLLYGDPEYCYSACYMAYVYLSNALYKVNYDAWLETRQGLSDGVKADIANNAAYWDRFETPVQTVANNVYENFLQSFSQELGMQSYGACVDLLVNYYIDDAKAALSSP